MVLDLLYRIWLFLLEISPYLIIGFMASGILSVLLSVETVSKYLGKNKPFSVFFASLLGIPLPLCSCGVIPVFSYLKKHGASKGATTSFLISTPQTGVDSIMITYSLLGPIFAIFRPIVAFVSGIIGGILVNWLDKEESVIKSSDKCEDDCCEDEGNLLYRIFNYGFVKLPEDIGNVLVVGILAAALIGLIIPQNYFMNIGGGIMGMLIMLLLGLPSYICATASVPLALALHLKGFSMGALIVFLMTGPATNIATISVSIKQIGKKATAIYVSTIICCSIFAGLIFDMLYPGLKIEDSLSHVHHVSGNIEVLSAILLILILLNVFRIKYFSNTKTNINNSSTTSSLSLFIDGMTCNHCIDSVTKTLNKINGVTVEKINLKTGEICYFDTGSNLNEVCSNIKDLGFEIKDD